MVAVCRVARYRPCDPLELAAVNHAIHMRPCAPPPALVAAANPARAVEDGELGVVTVVGKRAQPLRETRGLRLRPAGRRRAATATDLDQGGLGG